MQVRTPIDIGNIVREARRLSGLSQAKLAKQIGSTQSWISEVENGKETAELGLVLKLLSVLQITLELSPTYEVFAAPEEVEKPNLDRIIRGPGGDFER